MAFPGPIAIDRSTMTTNVHWAGGQPQVVGDDRADILNCGEFKSIKTCFWNPLVLNYEEIYGSW